MEQPGWNITIREMLRRPICSFIELNEGTSLFLVKSLHPLLYIYIIELTQTNDLPSEHSNQKYQKTPEMKPGINLHSLIFNVLPSIKIKRINHATHLFIFIRPNGSRALSQRESPSNVVTLTERPAGRRPFMACVLRALAWIIAQLVHGGKLQCESLLRNPPTGKDHSWNH